jgi:hypothetical protein
MELDHWSQLSKSIRFKIDVFDENNEDVDVMELEDSRPDTMKPGGSFRSGHIVLGAVQKRCSLKQIADDHADDPAFTRFHSKFGQFIKANRDSLSDEDIDILLDSSAMVRMITCSNISYPINIPPDT